MDIQLSLWNEETETGGKRPVTRRETPHERLTRKEQEYEDKLWAAQKKAHKEGRKIPTVIRK